MTVKEIALLAGVSIGTVDRVLHGRGRVSETTRQTIETIIAEGGYKANPIARHLRRGKGYVFAALLPRGDEDAGYWNLALAGIQRAALALEPFRIRVEVREFDRFQPGAAALALSASIGDRVNGILLAPVNHAEIRPVLDKLGSNIPYVFFDALASGLAPVCVVGQDPYRSGWFAARLMSLLRPQPAHYLLVNPHPSDLHLQSRVQGFREFFGNNPECLFSESTFIPDIDFAGVFIANASLAEFVKSIAGWPDLVERPAIIGYDLVPDNVQLLRDGLIDCLISQRPEFQSYEGIMTLYRHIVLQETSLSRLDAPLDAYFRENLPVQA